MCLYRFKRGQCICENKQQSLCIFQACTDHPLSDSDGWVAATKQKQSRCCKWIINSITYSFNATDVVVVRLNTPPSLTMWEMDDLKLIRSLKNANRCWFCLGFFCWSETEYFEILSQQDVCWKTSGMTVRFRCVLKRKLNQRAQHGTMTDSTSATRTVLISLVIPHLIWCFLCIIFYWNNRAMQ